MADKLVQCIEVIAVLDDKIIINVICSHHGKSALLQRRGSYSAIKSVLLANCRRNLIFNSQNLIVGWA